MDETSIASRQKMSSLAERVSQISNRQLRNGSMEGELDHEYKLDLKKTLGNEPSLFEGGILGT